MEGVRNSILGARPKQLAGGEPVWLEAENDPEREHKPAGPVNATTTESPRPAPPPLETVSEGGGARMNTANHGFLSGDVRRTRRFGARDRGAGALGSSDESSTRGAE